MSIFITSYLISFIVLNVKIQLEIKKRVSLKVRNYHFIFRSNLLFLEKIWLTTEQAWLNIVNNWRLTIESSHDHTPDEKSQVAFTPHLGDNNREDSNSKSNFVLKQESYLNKYDNNSNYIPSNHLYKFNVATIKKLENQNGKNQNGQLLMENIRDIFIEGKNPDLVPSAKRSLQKTPLNSNLQRYIESFQFETPVAVNGGKLLKFATPSSNGASITTATSMRKINRFSPKVGIQSPLETRNASLCEESSQKLRYTPNAGTKNLMKQSLERIDKAIKRYNKNIELSVQPGPFELTNKPHSLSQMREYLESEGSSLFGGGIQIGCSPSAINRPKAFSENVCNSIVWDSDTQDIENFTLGPAQFKELRSNQIVKNLSSRNLIAEFQRENDKIDKISRIKKRRNIGKHSSADRANQYTKSTYYSGAPNEFAILANQNPINGPFGAVDSKHNFMKRERGSAPNIEIAVGFNNEVQTGVVIDEGYKYVSNRASAKHSIIFKGLDSRNGKIPRPNKVFYSQSPSPLKYQESRLTSEIKSVANKLTCLKVQDGRSSICSLNRGTLKIGSKCAIDLLKHSKDKKKFPKDFF